MYRVKFTTAYKKAYKLMKKRGLDISLLDEVVDLLRQGRQPLSNHTPTLSPQYARFYKPAEALPGPRSVPSDPARHPYLPPASVPGPDSR